MMNAIHFWDALRWLERSSLAEAVRVAPFLYPMLESLHVLGIALLVGAAIAWRKRGVLPDITEQYVVGELREMRRNIAE